MNYPFAVLVTLLSLFILEHLSPEILPLTKQFKAQMTVRGLDDSELKVATVSPHVD